MNVDRLRKYLKQNNNEISLALGTFRITKSIGQGGNGLVYEVALLNEVLAMKFLVTEASGNTLKNKIQRFVAEYFNIAKLENVASIIKYLDYDLLKINDEFGPLEIPIIIMKRYESALKNKENNSDNFKKLFNFLINTTESIHNSGIVHRDIKPENILVEDNNFFLADFGIASYNPEIFQIRAETVKNERIGNRLFSAPEQEETGIEAHPTMDIYAIGQVLQWYVTGKTHRGTGRQNISNILGSDFELYDKIIHKCLENNPTKRFQSIQEIKDYIRKIREKEAEEDPFEYLELFNQICRSSFPKNESGIVYSNNIPRIDTLFSKLQKEEPIFGRTLWWHDGLGNFEFKLLQKGEGRWKFNEREYKIKEIWINYNERVFNDFILVHYASDAPLLINEKEVYYTVIIDDKYHISYNEFVNNYAEIEDEIIDLSEHKVEQIIRQEKEGYFFIGNRFHCIIRTKNDETVRQFIAKALIETKIDIKELLEFEWIIRKNKHREVVARL